MILDFLSLSIKFWRYNSFLKKNGWHERLGCLYLFHAAYCPFQYEKYEHALALDSRWILCGMNILHFPLLTRTNGFNTHAVWFCEILQRTGFDQKNLIFWHINLRIVSGHTDNIKRYVLSRANRRPKAAECLSKYSPLAPQGRFGDISTSPVRWEIIKPQEVHMGMNNACPDTGLENRHLFYIQIVTVIFNHLYL